MQSSLIKLFFFTLFKLLKLSLRYKLGSYVVGSFIFKWLKKVPGERCNIYSIETYLVENPPLIAFTASFNDLKHP